jgi:hypothetical protein
MVAKIGPFQTQCAFLGGFKDNQNQENPDFLRQGS